MVFEEEFKLLSLQKLNKKNANEIKNEDERYFYIVNVLDKENNPCKFFSFNKDINKDLTTRLNTGALKGLQDCLIKFDVVFQEKNWNVRLEEITFEY